ncbi:winged helix-turn-helix domain-containing protein [Rhizobium sp. CF142]|uniref:winged helix-turn-helix domain-containing protein n=1 Tax=Rhizobium sp. CF142 TaxID=1144314 RepID=UPI00026EF39E|nr:winged helix-turn-helix domain-containing protein [Rhizobium sp. CF142]EJJ25288.1 response regulator with CheY-like receiver domain and winged-helix DNA-binding domain [Rhizobium sp. CF142]
MQHILVVDDDRSARSLISDFLVQQAFRVTAVSSGDELQSVLSTDMIDAFVIDLNLKGEDALEIVRQLATLLTAPIVITSADRIEEADKVLGFELGASDYITKPFGLREFLARLKAAMRVRPAPETGRERRTYMFGDWTLSMRQRTLTRPEFGETKLTAAEFNLLVAFLNAPEQVLSREKLLAASRVHSEEIFDRSIDALVLRLRRKLETEPSNPRLIRTARGTGYILDCSVTVDERPRLKK